MARRRDAVEEAADEDRDLYDVATWERRTALDGFSVLVYRLLLLAGRVAVVLAALGILVAQFALGGLSAEATDPRVVALVPLSVLPALGLVAYVWRSDVTARQPLHLLVVTFLFGVLFAMFAAVANSLLGAVFLALGAVGTPLFFYLVVAPVEETVKLLAVRLHAFGHGSFASVVDGAVYGAVAGLGFATIENYLYIARGLQSATGSEGALVGAVTGVAAVRALAGPGHVIYSAIAGYYLGLAKFNPEDSGPIVVKGLLLAAFVHGTYNVLVGVLPGLLGTTLAWSDSPVVGYVAFVVAYDGLFGLFLFRKLRAYARAHDEVRDAERDAEPEEGDAEPDHPEETVRADSAEFDP